jgi:hypothetical protein
MYLKPTKMNTTKTCLLATLLFITACKKENISEPTSVVTHEDVINDSIYVGAHYHGGIIFWIDSTGQHGLIAATQDQTLGMAWSDGSYTEVGGTSKQIGKGFSNTKRIILTLGKGTYAALLCATYAVENYSDWYLPSLKELKLLYDNRDILAITGINYWSSSEYDGTYAYSRSLVNGVPAIEDKNITSDAVRAIRRF